MTPNTAARPRGPARLRLADIPYTSEASWLERPNRFLGLVRLADGSRHKVHVRDPGRLTELLYPGNRVLIRRAEAAARRKTAWDLVAARFDQQWVLVNSGHHPAIARALLSHPGLCPFGPLHSIQPEVKFGRSRLDFLLEIDKEACLKTGPGNEGQNCGKIYLEVKGCTLARQGVALFPDAPTTRGARHLEELIEARRLGFGAAVLILVFRQDAEIFAPNRETDPNFAEVFQQAVEAGVECCPVKIEYSAARQAAFYVERLPFKI